jgi:hypothetical protein
MKKLNQLELKNFVTVVVAETNQLIDDYNKKLPRTKEYLDGEEAILSGPGFLKCKETLTELKTLLKTDELGGSISNSLQCYMKDFERNFVSQKLTEMFPLKRSYGRKGDWGSRYSVGEGYVVVANSNVDEAKKLPYADVEEFKQAMVQKLFNEA